MYLQLLLIPFLHAMRQAETDPEPDLERLVERIVSRTYANDSGEDELA